MATLKVGAMLPHEHIIAEARVLASKSPNIETPQKAQLPKAPPAPHKAWDTLALPPPSAPQTPTPKAWGGALPMALRAAASKTKAAGPALTQPRASNILRNARAAAAATSPPQLVRTPGIVLQGREVTVSKAHWEEANFLKHVARHASLKNAGERERAQAILNSSASPARPAYIHVTDFRDPTNPRSNRNRGDITRVDLATRTIVAATSQGVIKSLYQCADTAAAQRHFEGEVRKDQMRAQQSR